MRVCISLLVVALFTSGCGPASSELDPAAPAVAEGDTRVGADSSFLLMVGQTVEVISGVTLRLDGVTQDSRCPTGVTCVWEGDAIARVSVSGTDFQQTVELHTTVAPHTGPGRATVGTLAIELVALDPYPAGDQPIPQADYRLTVRVTDP